MSKYERSITVNANVDAVFAYFSDVGNLPEYLREMKSAEPGEGDEVEVTAEVDIPGQGPTVVHNEAWFKVDDASHRIEWGSEGDNDYRGSLDATAAGDRSTLLTIEVNTVNVEGHDIDESLDEALRRIADAVEQL